MAEKLDPKEIVTLEELAISSMWEMAALVEVLEKKGVLKKQDILDAIRELRHVKMAANGFTGFPKWAWRGRDWVRCGWLVPAGPWGQLLKVNLGHQKRGNTESCTGGSNSPKFLGAAPWAVDTF